MCRVYIFVYMPLVYPSQILSGADTGFGRGGGGPKKYLSGITASQSEYIVHKSNKCLLQ